MDLWILLVQPKLEKEHPEQVAQTQVQVASKDLQSGYFYICLGNLFQDSVSHTVKCFLMVRQKLLHSYLPWHYVPMEKACLCPLCPLCTLPRGIYTC